MDKGSVRFENIIIGLTSGVAAIALSYIVSMSYSLSEDPIILVFYVLSMMIVVLLMASNFQWSG